MPYTACSAVKIRSIPLSRDAAGGFGRKTSQKVTDDSIYDCMRAVGVDNKSVGSCVDMMYEQSSA